MDCAELAARHADQEYLASPAHQRVLQQAATRDDPALAKRLLERYTDEALADFADSMSEEIRRRRRKPDADPTVFEAVAIEGFLRDDKNLPDDLRHAVKMGRYDLDALRRVEQSQCDAAIRVHEKAVAEFLAPMQELFKELPESVYVKQWVNWTPYDSDYLRIGREEYLGGTYTHQHTAALNCPGCVSILLAFKRDMTASKPGDRPWGLLSFGVCESDAKTTQYAALGVAIAAAREAWLSPIPF